MRVPRGGSHSLGIGSKGIMKRLRILMASWEEVVEPLFREAIKDGGHYLAIINPWKREIGFLAEAKTGAYDVVIVTNLCLPLGYSLRLIAPLRRTCSARVIVMSGAADQEDREMAIREGACAFYQLPILVDMIREAVEAAAR